MTVTRRVIGPNNVPTMNFNAQQYGALTSGVNGLMSNLNRAYANASNTIGRQIDQNNAVYNSSVNDVKQFGQQLQNILQMRNKTLDNLDAMDMSLYNQAANKVGNLIANKYNAEQKINNQIELTKRLTAAKTDAAIDAKIGMLTKLGYTKDQAVALLRNSLTGGNNSLAGMLNGSGNSVGGNGTSIGLGNGMGKNARTTISVAKTVANNNIQLGTANQELNKLNTLLPGSIVRDKQGNIMFNTNNKDLTAILGLMGVTKNDLDKYTMSVRGKLGTVIKIPDATLLNKINTIVSKIRNGQIHFDRDGAYITDSNTKNRLININSNVLKTVIDNPNAVGNNLGYDLYKSFVNYRKGNVGLGTLADTNTILDSELDDILEDKRVKANVINTINNSHLTFDDNGNIVRNGKPLNQLSGKAQEKVVKTFILNKVTLPAILQGTTNKLRNTLTGTNWLDSNLKLYEQLQSGVY